jgi:hypothetical protein
MSPPASSKMTARKGISRHGDHKAPPAVCKRDATESFTFFSGLKSERGRWCQGAIFSRTVATLSSARAQHVQRPSGSAPAGAALPGRHHSARQAGQKLTYSDCRWGRTSDRKASRLTVDSVRRQLFRRVSPHALGLQITSRLQQLRQLRCHCPPRRRGKSLPQYHRPPRPPPLPPPVSLPARRSAAGVHCLR